MLTFRFLGGGNIMVPQVAYLSPTRGRAVEGPEFHPRGRRLRNHATTPRPRNHPEIGGQIIGTPVWPVRFLFIVVAIATTAAMVTFRVFGFGPRGPGT